MSKKTLESNILAKLATAKANLKRCGKNESDADLVVLAFLDLLNSGKVEGEFKVRINGHVVSTPRVDGYMIRLDEVEHKVVMEREDH